ncbi:NADPH-dependent F420 reductase [Dyadobacter subterraneus]|uniref:NADPH-dependent F420 reductase n=1 Tax=Dyadobacter subterraneus TaxID=2773304 RepID=A0ABR9WD79_9BACT|nr:NADPH-dependent F420 reductase [Dyadobacter subterraneus]MBE9463375.1 NADPH-dependent F420 reductase [Dyadobacter subterraneus]
MTIGIIGAGRIAKAFARQIIKSGYQVAISNSRGPQSMQGLINDLGSGIQAVTTQEAAQAKIVLLAVQWAHLPQALANLPPWDGRIVIDATNPSLAFEPFANAADLGEKTSSELVAELVPGARLVKAFNTIYYKLLENHRQEEHGKRVIFMSGDDRYAKKQCSEIVKRIGFAPVDLGNLVNGGRMQQLGGPLAHLHLLHMQPSF